MRFGSPVVNEGKLSRFCFSWVRRIAIESPAKFLSSFISSFIDSK